MLYVFRKITLNFVFRQNKLSLANNSNWRPRVHALNVLRALYKDASLRVDVIPFVAEGIRISVKGAYR